MEFGCGDGNQLKLAQYPSYSGIDISETALTICRKSFANDTTKKFSLYNPGNAVGKFDLVEDVLRELGAQIFFHKVAVRPGKPILFGELPTPGNVLVGSGQALICFGLPGNPIAVAAGARFFVLPFLRALLGGNLEVAHRLPILEQASTPGGLVFFQRGVRFGQGVKALNGQASFMTSSLMEAEGWIVSHSEGPVITKGELVEWYPLWS